MYKRNLVAALIAFTITGGFLAFLCVWLKAPPLIIICLGVMLLSLWDAHRSIREKNENS
jgi:hypothetical protein